MWWLIFPIAAVISAGLMGYHTIFDHKKKPKAPKPKPIKLGKVDESSYEDPDKVPSEIKIAAKKKKTVVVKEIDKKKTETAVEQTKVEEVNIVPDNVEVPNQEKQSNNYHSNFDNKKVEETKTNTLLDETENENIDEELDDDFYFLGDYSDKENIARQIRDLPKAIKVLMISDVFDKKYN